MIDFANQEHAASPPQLNSAITIRLDELLPELAAVQQQHHLRAVETGMPLHITLLFPFVPCDELNAHLYGVLSAYASGHEPFTISLESIDEFPGVLYASLAPNAELTDLTRGLWAAFPATPPYGGAFDEPIAHATLSEASAEAQAEATQALKRQTECLWPQRCVVRNFSLFEEHAPNRWRETERFTLGSDIP